MLQKAKQNLAFKENADLFSAFLSFGNAREWEMEAEALVVED